MQEGEGDSVEEDGAVDLLMQGASADLLSHAEDESPDQAKRTWMQQLWNLQRAAVSAASAVGSVGQLLPNRIHFGNASSWAKVHFKVIMSRSSTQPAQCPDLTPCPLLINL